MACSQHFQNYFRELFTAFACHFSAAVLVLYNIPFTPQLFQRFRIRLFYPSIAAAN